MHGTVRVTISTEAKMRTIFLSIFLMLLVGLLLSPAYSQQNDSLPSFDKAKVWTSELPNFISNYQTARKQLHEKFQVVNRPDFTLDSEISRQSFSDLVRAYFEFKKVRASKDELWFLIFLIRNDPDILVNINWTKEQIETSQSWYNKFLEVREKIKRMDSKYVSEFKVEQFLLQYNTDMITVF